MPEVTHDSGAVGPLHAHLVVDLSRALAGPHAAMMLGDMGARGIEVETPIGGDDDSRGWGPPFVGEAGTPEFVSTYFLSANRNKESVALDLKVESDRDTVLELIAHADVLVDNFRPGVLDRLGLGLPSLVKLNPGLVVLSITGFGHDGPEAARPGYDQIAQGETGLMSLTGPSPDDPQRMGVPICDLVAGINRAAGVNAALVERSRTGRGQIVRTSLLAAGVSIHAFQGTRWTVGAELARAGGNHHPTIAPYGLFRCADGNVQIAVGSESLWQKLAHGFDLPAEDRRFAANADRVAHRAEVIDLLQDTFSTWTREDLLAELDALWIPAGVVRMLDEVYAWDQVESQGLKIDVDHPVGHMTRPGAPLRFFDAEGVERTRRRHQHPPVLDGDGAEVREWVGRTPDPMLGSVADPAGS